MHIRNHSLFIQVCHLNVKRDILYSFRLDGVGVHNTGFKERDRLLHTQCRSGQTASTDSRDEQSDPMGSRVAEAHVKG